MTDTTVAPALDPAQFGREWEAWHRAHEARRTDPHGFLAVTGLTPTRYRELARGRQAGAKS